MSDRHDFQFPFVSCEITIRGRLADGQTGELRIPQVKIADPDDFRFRDEIETLELRDSPDSVIAHAIFEKHRLSLDVAGEPIREGESPILFTYREAP